MAHDNDERRLEDCDGELDGREDCLVGRHVARSAQDEKGANLGAEEDLWRDAAVGASDDGRDRVLAVRRNVVAQGLRRRRVGRRVGRVEGVRSEEGYEGFVGGCEGRVGGGLRGC